MSIPRVVIVMSRCSTDPDSTFGIRVEERETSTWYATWAFSLPPAMAAREGYNKAEARGAFLVDEGEYPGCPNCRRSGFVLCGKCDRLGCWSAAEQSHRCPWCGNSGRVGAGITRLSTGGDA